MVFTKLLLENARSIRPCNYDAASEPLLPKVARCIPVLSSRYIGKCAARVLKRSEITHVKFCKLLCGSFILGKDESCLSVLRGHFQLSSPWHVCPSTCFSRTNCSLSRYNAKGKLDCFNCKTGFFVRLFTPMFTKESNYNSSFWEKSQLLYGQYLTIIKKN